MSRPRRNKRQRRAQRKANENAGIGKLISQYERELKSTHYESEARRLTAEINRLRDLADTGNAKQKKKAKSVLQPKPDIPTSLVKKKGRSGDWVPVYQGGSTGLKR